MSISRTEPPDLDREFTALINRFKRRPSDPDLRTEAVDLAYRLRSRLIDLATIKADYSAEYEKRTQQAKEMVNLAGHHADELLVKEFGSSAA